MVAIAHPQYEVPGTERVTPDDPAFTRALQTAFGPRCNPGANPHAVAGGCLIELDSGPGFPSQELVLEGFRYTRHVTLWRIWPPAGAPWDGAKSFTVIVVTDNSLDGHRDHHELILVLDGISLDLEASLPRAIHTDDFVTFIMALKNRLIMRAKRIVG
jgi:hypothetical protein